LHRVTISPGQTLRLPQPPGGTEQVHVLSENEILAIETALAARRALLVRGEPGTGKTQFAKAAAVALGRAFVPFVVDSRTEARDVLWYFDAVARLAEAQVQGALLGDRQEHAPLREALAIENFIHPRALWWAFDWEGAKGQAARARAPVPTQPEGCDPAKGVVVLIDEVDKADADVPNGLLEALGAGEFTPQGLTRPVTVKNENVPPLVGITTNEERSLPDAFLRRCLVLHLRLPDERQQLVEHLAERGAAHFPDVDREILTFAAGMVADDRARAGRRIGSRFPDKRSSSISFARSRIWERATPRRRRRCWSGLRPLPCASALRSQCESYARWTGRPCPNARRERSRAGTAGRRTARLLADPAAAAASLDGADADAAGGVFRAAGQQRRPAHTDTLLAGRYLCPAHSGGRGGRTAHCSSDMEKCAGQPARPALAVAVARTSTAVVGGDRDRDPDRRDRCGRGGGHVCSGHQLDRLPHQQRRRLATHLQVILDRSDRLVPFWDDQDLVAAALRVLLPRHRLTFGVVYEGLDEPRLLTADGAASPYELPPMGGVVLVLGDLGCLDHGGDEAVGQWRRFGGRIAAAGCVAAALLPAPLVRRPADLKALWRTVAWERSAPGAAGQDPATLRQRADRLLALASPAVRLEPGLLRDIRRGLDPAEADAGTEADVWQHAAIASRSPVAASLHPEAGKQLRAVFAAEPAETQRAVLQLMRRWRHGVADEIWFEEILNLPTDALSDLLEDLEDARHFFAFSMQVPAPSPVGPRTLSCGSIG